ncbi:hypothetical protein RI054_05g26750 [Pseudoscourfieldia marina]
MEDDAVRFVAATSGSPWCLCAVCLFEGPNLTDLGDFVDNASVKRLRVARALREIRAAAAARIHGGRSEYSQLRDGLFRQGENEAFDEVVATAIADLESSENLGGGSAGDGGGGDGNGNGGSGDGDGRVADSDSRSAGVAAASLHPLPIDGASTEATRSPCQQQRHVRQPPQPPSQQHHTALQLPPLLPTQRRQTIQVPPPPPLPPPPPQPPHQQTVQPPPPPPPPIFACASCLRTMSEKARMPDAALANGYWPGLVPAELADLTDIEERMISPIVPVTRFSMITGSQPGDSFGWSFVNRVAEVANQLPRVLNATHAVRFVSMGVPSSTSSHVVRPDRVIRAVRFLKTHNFLYETVDINEEVLTTSTESDGGGPVIDIPPIDADVSSASNPETVLIDAQPEDDDFLSALGNR